MAISFPAEFARTGRQGTVVEFTTSDGEIWTGNFRPGEFFGVDGAYPHPNGRDVLVASAGTLYSVHADKRSANILIDPVLAAWEYSGDLILDCQGLKYARLGPGGFVWETRRISWDGFKWASIEGNRLSGLAWNPLDGGEWVPFTVDLESGDAEGGSYDEDNVVVHRL